ncbi:integral peroxisomal membrane peroxin-domain-containing protein [Choanephora cucurbitarum]|nr:integral peroxisomal membrane peroxin-domain-containing protein [Choanephora cucurbitarum]
MLHSFEETTFSKPTYCDLCQGLLWGLVKQGLQCSGCQAICHKHCQNKMPGCSREKLVENPTIYRKEDTPATKSLRSLQQQLDISKAPKKKATVPSSEELETILVSAAIHADQTQVAEQYMANLPPLNPQTTAKNFSRFVSRCGPMFTFRDRVILLLNWDKPVESWIALLAYCLLCLYPFLLTLIPQAIVCYIILTMLVSRQQQQQDKSDTKPTPQPASKLPKVESTAVPQPALGPSKFNNLAAAFFPTAFDESSPEYMRNMQNLQNMMGELSDVYDLIASQQYWVDWSDEQRTSSVFQLAVLSCIPTLLLVWCVPFQYLCLMTGMGLFMLNTRFMKFLTKECMPYLTELGQEGYQKFRSYVAQVEHQLDQQEAQKEISLYENQRWWPESGFVPHLLPGERSLWSDRSGKLNYPAKEEFSAPKGYAWREDDWILDESGPWMDDILCLEYTVVPESGGWVYTDHNWQHTASKQEDNVTRRRRWVRHCQKDLK